MKRAGWDPRRDLAPEQLETLVNSAASEQLEVSDNLMRLLRDDPASPFRVTRDEQP